MRKSCRSISSTDLEAIRAAVKDQLPIAGLTHTFYRYPARFSPSFARACIEKFTKPGDLVLDPYMGGGTTVVEAMVSGRRSIGSDINELAVFVADVKVSKLFPAERRELARWADKVVPSIRCDEPAPQDSHVPRNMHLPEARWLRKTISLALDTLDEELPTSKSRRFARCVVLNVGQWALNGRKRVPTASEFRERIAGTTHEMLAGSRELNDRLGPKTTKPLLRKNDAEAVADDRKIQQYGLADLVVTSPPYPGVHILYHRWQVDGRKETDAPYWISGTKIAGAR
ncbi:MAG: hypothetical protein IH985_10240 [Planctomycetes bacterium]|nr:hypothetical protein [Planctomycetota bacterium]